MESIIIKNMLKQYFNKLYDKTISAKVITDIFNYENLEELIFQDDMDEDILNQNKSNILEIINKFINDINNLKKNQKNNLEELINEIITYKFYKYQITYYNINFLINLIPIKIEFSYSYPDIFKIIKKLKYEVCINYFIENKIKHEEKNLFEFLIKIYKKDKNDLLEILELDNNNIICKSIKNLKIKNNYCKTKILYKKIINEKNISPHIKNFYKKIL